MSNLLFAKQPLVINPDLAELIGLNEAIVLQQVNYWIEINKKTNKNLRDGRYWTYNKYETWREDHFKFWSVVTVKRTFLSLEKMGLLLSSEEFNEMKVDRTKWYTIDFDAVESLVIRPSDQIDTMHNGAAFQEATTEKPRHDASYQIDPSIGSKRSDGWDQIDPTNNQRLTRDYVKEINKEKNKDRIRDHRSWDEITIGLLPEPEYTHIHKLLGIYLQKRDWLFKSHQVPRPLPAEWEVMLTDLIVATMGDVSIMQELIEEASQLGKLSFMTLLKDEINKENKRKNNTSTFGGNSGGNNANTRYYNRPQKNRTNTFMQYYESQHGAMSGV